MRKFDALDDAIPQSDPPKVSDPDPVDILLVDDVPANLLALSAILRRSDYRIKTAASGEDALAQLKTREFAVLVVDVMMPGMDGLELVRRVRAGSGRNQSTPALFVTALARDMMHKMDAYALGAADYLMKPLDEGEVASKVAVFADLYRAKRSLARLNRDLETKAAERARDLAAESERFRVFVDSVQDHAFIQTDAAGRFLTWNFGAERLLGYKANEIVGQPFKTIFTQRDVEAGQPARELETAARSGKANDTRWQRRKDGSIFWARGTTYPLRDDAGRLTGYAKVLRDETDRRTTEEALKASEAQLRVVADSVPAFVCYVDLSQRFRFVNAMVKSWFGVAPEDATGELARQIVGPAIFDLLRPSMLATLAGTPTTIDLQLKDREGRTRHAHGSFTPDRRDGEQVVGAIGLFIDVTAQREAELARRDSEELLQVAIAATRLGTWDVSPATGVRTWSARTHEILDVPADAVPTQELFLSRIHPDDRTRIERGLARALGEPEHARFDAEFRILGRDGGDRWGRVTGQVVRDEAGKALRFAGTLQDVSEAHAISAALASNAAQFRALADTIPQLAWMADATGSVYWYNERWYQYTGTTLEDAGGRRWEKVHHPDHRERVISEFDRCLKSGQPWEDTFPIRSADGEWRWFLSRAVPIRDGGGRVTSWFGTNTDVTDLRRALEAEARLAAIVAGSDDAIVAKDFKSIITSWNAAAERMFGYSAEEMVGQSITMIIPHERLAEEDAIIAAISRGERIAHFETQRRRKDGSLIDVSLSIFPVRDHFDRIIGIAKIARDITEQKRVAGELRIAKEAADRANRAKSLFLANMSHEIRTPLGAILGFTDLLLEPDLAPADLRTYAATIRRNGRLLSQLIDDILDLSKVEAGKLTIERVTCMLPTIVADVYAMFEGQARDRGIAFDVRFAPGVPEKITSDPVRLKQTLVNIIGNAIKFTRQGGVDVLVRVSAGEIEFVVTDTGRGLSPAEQGHLFEPFAQADASTTREYGGTGLGLVLSRRLARALGGDVRLTASAPRRGSTFVITIDPGQTYGQIAATSQRALAAHDDSIAPGMPAGKRLNGMRLMVAEDSPDGRFLMKRLLEREGAAVTFAQDGIEATEKALAGDFDAILMDIAMPRRDGLQATDELRRSGYRRPIIALTAHAMKEERDRASQAGCDDHLTKPINLEALIAVLGRLAPPN